MQRSMVGRTLPATTPDFRAPEGLGVGLRDSVALDPLGDWQPRCWGGELALDNGQPRYTARKKHPLGTSREPKAGGEGIGKRTYARRVKLSSRYRREEVA